MTVVKCANQPDMKQEEVCIVLKEMDVMLHNMYTLIMQSSNVLEYELANLVIKDMLGKKSRSNMYYGNIIKYALPILKLTSIKNIDKVHKIICKIELTRDMGMRIIEKFLEETKKYASLMKELSDISHSFHEGGKKASFYNKIMKKITSIEVKIKGVRENLYGAIRNIKDIQAKYYNKRNKIVLSYLKLDLGVACRLTTNVSDNFQNGVVGILKAIDKSRVDKLEQKVYSFANFVKWHIKNAIMNTEFNPRTDLAFNVHPYQIIKQTHVGEEYYFLKGERFIDIVNNDLSYTPDYIKEDNEKTFLNREEQNVIAFLNGDPSECKFENYPTEEEISREIKRQKRNKIR